MSPLKFSVRQALRLVYGFLPPGRHVSFGPNRLLDLYVDPLQAFRMLSHVDGSGSPLVIRGIFLGIQSSTVPKGGLPPTFVTK
jgi:hypothetical protein